MQVAIASHEGDYLHSGWQAWLRLSLPHVQSKGSARAQPIMP